MGALWEFNERWMISFRWKYATGRPRDDFIIHSNALAGIGGPVRFSQEFISNGTLSWDDYHSLNVRVDYRRPLGFVDFIAFFRRRQSLTDQSHRTYVSLIQSRVI